MKIGVAFIITGVFVVVAGMFYVGLLWFSLKYVKYPLFFFPIVYGGSVLFFAVSKLITWVFDKNLVTPPQRKGVREHLTVVKLVRE